MKITLSETDIFTPNLKEQFFLELKPRLGELDLEKTYTLTLFFDEYCLLDREQMDAFVIPREALPRYLQDREMTGEEKDSLKEAKGLVEKFEAAMDDDFNTADAISAIFELVKLANSTAGESTAAYVAEIRDIIVKLCDVLGIITETKEEMLDADIEEMIARRQQARKEKNFALADQIRGELLEKGIILEDTREGVKWKRA